MIVKENLDGIDIDNIRNLEDLLRLVCSSMKIVVILKYSLTVETLLKILTNRRSQAFYKLIDVLTNVIGESISSIRMSSIVNE